MKQKIAIQGIEGSFHHQVARECFGKQAELKKCMSSEEVAVSLKNSEAGVGIMAIENSIAGGILPNFRLIEEYDLQIVGEYYLPVQMNLLAVPGQKIEDVKEVFSHPMDLLQCRDFFRDFPQMELVDDADTASVAKRIAEEGRKNVAAVASKTAAELFGLQVLAENIHNRKTNTTRFFVLQPRNREERILNADKATFKLVKKGNSEELSNFLQQLKELELEVVNVQKAEASAYVDVLFKDPNLLQQALSLPGQDIQLLGVYRNKLQQKEEQETRISEAKAV